ncbi:MAG: Ig-like domain-containing protein [Aristaeellaceae bacterium]
MKRTIAALLALLLVSLALPGMAEQTTFALKKENNRVFVGETVQMELNRTGEAAEGELTFTSSNEKCATVDAQGVVTGLSKGQATITARLQTEKRTFKSSLTVTVAVKAEEISVTEDALPIYDAADPFVAPLLAPAEEEDAEELGADDGDAAGDAAGEDAEEPLPVLVLRMGSQQALKATVLPATANDRAVVLTTSDESIVRAQGLTLTPRAVGECDLTIASRQNPEVIRQYHLLVVQPVTRLQITAEKKTTILGGTLPLTVTYTPENASIQQVTWQSSNEKVATVDENGVVTGVSKGTATIKATAVDGSRRTATYQVTVQQQPESITLKETSAVVNVGSYKTLTATVLPAATNDKTVTWSSSDEGVATVNAKGRVTPVAPGVCVITCQSKSYPEVYATATVEVHQLVTKITFADNDVSFNVGDTCQLFWQTAPANATNTALTFKSSNETIATVTDDGLVSGLKRGSCTITATAADGSGKKATVKISVLQPVLGVHMENDTIRVGVDESYTARAILEPTDASNTAMSWTSADTSIATVKGTRNKPTITGKRWGTTTITGVTQDGGYTTTATVNVGDYDKALRINDLYLANNRIKIVVNNASNMTVTRFTFIIECYDIYDAPLPCSENGSHTFYGSYSLTLYEGESTEHGRFYFGNFVQPEAQIGRVVMSITGYSTDTGYSRDIRSDRQPVLEFCSSSFVGATASPVPVVTPPAE